MQKGAGRGGGEVGRCPSDSEGKLPNPRILKEGKEKGKKVKKMNEKEKREEKAKNIKSLPYFDISIAFWGRRRVDKPPPFNILVLPPPQSDF